jgi:NADH:ubiquinone oxidoreductase subunit F (NADH-binding)/ferredoxin
MGISIKEVIEDIGGGIAGGLRFKAVQVGGPSGGCVPAKLAHVSVDYETLKDVGAMMGSGGLVALDESDCMVDIARYFLEFTQNQSCGKCTFCRIGTRRMLDILERLCAGEGKKTDIEELEHLAQMIQNTSICGLGGTAPNPVLSTIKYFRDEYEAHLDRRCPAGRCRALITYSVTDDCIGCTLCAQHCPADAIEMKPYEKHEIDSDKCIRCGTCKSICPADAVKVE